ncbi:hypothetical protein AvCA_01170 [Azotobacter vinelandii CA]|uniref:Lipoprotein n=2 Tax=Azotobacter vinelandii TaxID=354 RepID=C1DGX7_AZOVD|nr:hypothetical protein [Azotobacter vinelandii]ACO76384.1 conserved hypothetical protein [Azotobacter vinelandii DJ]AGK15689.1 hypothetical protein AvCA_01170 [Azotobacter vinelandii CA]AGK19091.1 hypothetical protein AvCA6_01170 [Azotobacter vinelandii CA6]SFX76277.1 hypothetical protein SAMN04244547_02672 [Azotobacter vinelandii]GLK58150.1 hypothetical protein GCM10017624_03070 [Azotobacter vinelandii]
MRGRFPWLTLPLLLAGCAAPVPEPDPRMAWVELQAREVTSLLMADWQDGQRLRDGRYFQVAPGAHELEATYRYYYQGNPMGRNPLATSCWLRLRYPDFTAGQRYRLEAWNMSTQVYAVLYDSAGRELAEVEVLGCGLY